MKKIIAMAFICLSVVSCTRDSDPNYFGTVKPKHPLDEIWINNREEPQYMDPTLVAGVPDGELSQNTFYRLVALDPRTGQPVPELAERWDVTDGGKTHTFFMRKNLKWSDGHPLTAHDAEYAWKRLIDPQMASQYQGVAADVIENGNAFAQRAIHLIGFEKPVSESDIKSFFIKHDVNVSKVQQRRGTNEMFVFVSGKDGDETKTNRERMMQILIQEHPWGDKVSASITNSDVVEAKALDDERFQVKLIGPLAYFTLLAEFANFAPLPEHVIEKFKAAGKADDWYKPENVVVSGAFKLKEEQFKQYKIYEKNPNYWDADSVRLKKVKVLMIENETATLNSYKVGETDWIGPHNVPAEQIPDLGAFKDFHNDPYLGVYSFIMNVRQKPFDDPKVRQALSLAVDRQKITDHILGGGQIPTRGLFPDGLAGFKGYKAELYNPEKAKKLLAEAGYPEGKGFPKIKYLYDTKEVHKNIIQAIQEMWKQNLGIQVEPVNVEWKVYLDRIEKKDFQMARRAWIGDFADPFTFLEMEVSTSGNNNTNWSDSEYDRLIVASNMEPDPAKRGALINQAEAMAVEASARVPLYVYTKTYMLKPFVKGFYPSYQDHHAWRHMWIDLDWKKNK